MIGWSMPTQAKTNTTDLSFSVNDSCLVFIDTLVDSTGTLLTAVPLGNAPYTYSWTGGYTTPSLYVSTPGLYCVDIVDSTGCTSSSCFNFQQGNGCSTNIIPSPAWGLSASIQNGIPPYTYAWSNGSTTEMINPNQLGTYCVTTTDAIGCISSDCFDYGIISDSCWVDISVQLDTVGALLDAIAGGVAPFTYNWTGGYTTPGLYVSTPGLYCVEIVDALGCVANECYEYQDSINFCHVIIYEVQNGACLQADAIGNGPFTYNWSDGSTTPAICPPANGTYCVTATNTTGCQSTYCYDFNTVPSDSCWVDINVDLNPVGALLDAVAGGTAPYTYNWTGGYTTSGLYVTTPGLYCVDITDALGCIASECYDFQPMVDSCFTSISEIQNGGCLQANAFGVAPFTYEWSDGGTGSYICPSFAGTYCVTVTSATGCQAVDCYVYNNNDCSVFIMEADSLNSLNGLFAVASGVGPFNYAWNTGETTPMIVPTLSGDYCVTITDTIGCVASNCFYYASPNDSCWVTIYQDTLEPSTDLLIADWPQNGVGVTGFSWTPNGETGSSIIVSETGTYCVTINFANGCVATACYYYEANGGNVCDVSIAFPAPFDTCLYTTATGVAPFTYSWNDGTNASVYCPSEPGTYCVTMTDATGCVSVDCQIFEMNNNCVAYIFDSTAVGETWLWAYGSGPAPFSFSWSTGETSQVINPTISGNYCVTITDNNGCVSNTCFYYTSATTYNTISGTVYALDSLNLFQMYGTAFLIQYDTAGGGTLTLVDTVPLTQDPFGTFYDFGAVPDGEYLVKVALDENTPGYATNLPTYHYSSLFWDEATTITVPYNNPSWFNVVMVEGENLGGPGFIGGLIVEGANFAGFADTRGDGDPIANVLVLLLDDNDNAIAYTYTNQDGEYEFPDLAWGTYQVIVEIVGFEQAIYEITIGPDVPKVEDLTFVVDDDSVAFLDVTSVEEVVEISTFASFPNPVTDRLTIQMEMKTNSTLQLEVISIDGKVQIRQEKELTVGPQEFQIDMSRLANGLYFLNVIHDNEQISRKVMKQ